MIHLQANDGSAAEVESTASSSSDFIDFLSNGFKIRTYKFNVINGSGNDDISMLPLQNFQSYHRMMYRR